MPEFYTGTVTAYVNWSLIPKEVRWNLIDYFINDDSHTHCRITNLNSKSAGNGMTLIHFYFNEFDWIHLFWDIGNKFPDLQAWYMVAPTEKTASSAPEACISNDFEGRYFHIDDSKVKVIRSIREVRQDCEDDKTKA